MKRKEKLKGKKKDRTNLALLQTKIKEIEAQNHREETKLGQN